MTRCVCWTVLIVLLGACQIPRSSQVGELALINGRLYTLAWSEPAADGTPAEDAPWDGSSWRPDAQAVLVRDGRIAFVGSTAEVLARAGEGARTVDLAGATVLPGLIDAHTHVTEMARHEGQVSLVGTAGEAEAVARVAAFSKDIPKGRWIIGYGWDEGAWANGYPTLDALSRAVPDHPVLLTSLHGFAVWGNRRALSAVGIDRDTRAPSGGEILRDDKGEPTGVLLNRATPLLMDRVPDDAFPPLEKQVESALRQMARSGFVAVHEAGLSTELLAAYELLDEQGRLPIRVYAMLSARDAPLVRAWIRRGPRRAPEGRLEIRAVKAYYDGALGSRGAQLIDDYCDRAGHRGVAGGEYGFDEALVADAARAGYQIAVHAIGDAGNRNVLRFFEEVIASAPATRAGRHRIEHAQVVHEDDFERFPRSALIASVQPPHAVEDKTWAEARLGSARVRGAYAWRTLRRVGARLAFSSDLPGSDHDIFYGLHAAITRRDKQKQPSEGWYPEERMTPEEAVRGYTSWAAYAGFAEEVRGKIAPGFIADLTVLDIDPFVVGTKTPGELLDGKVLMTVVEGEVLHDARTTARPNTDTSPAAGTSGMVSSAHPIATRAGLDVLGRGGSAFDAAVAVASTLAVVEPMMSGPGGYGTVLVHDAKSGRSRFLNCSAHIPHGVDPDAYRAPTPGHLENRRGAKAVSTPGWVPALELMWQEHGRLPWQSLLESAARVAREGFRLDARTASLVARAYPAFPPHARAIFGRDGRPLRVGERLVQADLARSLRQLGDHGSEALRNGPLGRAVDAAMRAAGGFLRLDDLVRARGEWWDPIGIDYRGHHVLTASPPSTAFPSLIRLGMMSRYDASGLGHNSVAYLHHFAEVTKHAFWCRLRWAGDPDVAPPPLGRLLSEEYWAEQVDRIDAERARPFVPPGPVGDPGQHTTHFVVADAEGNVVSATLTLGNSFGSRIMPEGTGIWLNNSLAYCTFEPAGNPMDAHPGRRKLSGDCPTFIVRDGRVWAALGTPGGHTIGQTIPQIVMNLVDHGLDIQEAIHAPRISFIEPDRLAVERGIPAPVRRRLKQLGHPVFPASGLGNAHGLTISYGADGRPVRFEGGADPRGVGLALGR